jgi:hypothetical protein
MAQFRTDTQSLDPSISTRYEVVMLADENGNIVNSNNPIVANPSGVALDAFGRLRTSSHLRSLILLTVSETTDCGPRPIQPVLLTPITSMLV